uniref:Uncharacterized protein n=1 Tax=Anguilla anguilla TaxID=7936 RepID=A0A0E9TUY9_ANGAN
MLCQACTAAIFSSCLFQGLVIFSAYEMRVQLDSDQVNDSASQEFFQLLALLLLRQYV